MNPEIRNKIDPINEEEITIRKEFEKLEESGKQEKIAKAAARAWLENTPVLRKRAEVVKNEREQKDLLLVADIAEIIKAEGGYAYIVGGYARDEALKKFGYEVEPKDIDLEIYGTEPEKLQEILKTFGKINVVGASFGVIKLTLETGTIIDASIPRRDSKTSKGHKGFLVETDPKMTLFEASKRRDFTINALALDPLTGEIVDKHGGLDDIQNKILRATDDAAFAEDPLRVLRAAQFAGRFGFSIDPHTVELCRSLDLKELPAERIGEEWNKLLLKAPMPSIGLETMRELGVIEKLHPELQALIGVQQDPVWHPEGDVWEHTKLVIDAAARIVRRNNLPKEQPLIIMLAALCHDLGKPSTTEKNEKGRIISHGHSEAGIEHARLFLKSLKAPNALVEKVLPLIKEHLFPNINKNPTESAVRKLANRLYPATIQELVMVSEADVGGRGEILESFPEGETLLKLAAGLSLAEEKPQPIMIGRHLIEMGYTPGKNFGVILRKVFEAQLDGLVTNLNEAKTLAKNLADSAEITAKIQNELKTYSEIYEVRGLEGRLRRGLDPAGMLATQETREKLEVVGRALGAKMEEVIKFTNELHIGGIWKNADKLSRAEDTEVLMWLLMAYVTDEGKRSEGELDEKDFVKDLWRVNKILDEAVRNPKETTVKSKEALIARSKEDFEIDDSVPVSKVDNGFLAMAMNGYKSGIVRDKEGLLFVGADKLNYGILEKLSLKPTEKEDRGRKTIVYIDKNGSEVVKKLYQGFAIVLSKDMAIAKALARTGK